MFPMPGYYGAVLVMGADMLLENGLKVIVIEEEVIHSKESVIR